MFGYAFSNALINSVRGSAPLVVIGLAHQVIEPFVASPDAELVEDDPPPPELHALSTATVATAVATAASLRMRRLCLRARVMFFDMISSYSAEMPSTFGEHPASRRRRCPSRDVAQIAPVQGWATNWLPRRHVGRMPA
jgi:hypothetical protein